MEKYSELKDKVKELEQRTWDIPGIEKRLEKLAREGIPEKVLNPNQIISHRQKILDRVQLRGEEYEYLSHSCSKGSALAVMEEFGLGNMDIITSLSPFPGFGMTGWICGAVTGGLIALGLCFGSHDLLDYEATGRTMTAARTLITRFETALGTILCPKIHEDLIFGTYMDPRSSQEKFQAFKDAKGYEKCAVPPGIGARIAAEIIIEGMGDAAA